MKIYCDACCLNRPFDDQSQARIRLETEAIETVLAYIENGVWQGVCGNVLEFEIKSNPDIDRRFRVLRLLSIFDEKLQADQRDYDRARDLLKLGFKELDALHVACAERMKANVFLTTDDKLLKTAVREKKKLYVSVANPVYWLEEQLL